MIHVGFTLFITYETEEVLTNSGMDVLGWFRVPSLANMQHLFFGYKQWSRGSVGRSPCSNATVLQIS